MAIELIISRNLSTAARLKELIPNLQQFDALDPWKGAELDLSRVEWVTPLSVTPLSAKISEVSPYTILNTAHPATQSYLDTVFFPDGTDIAHLSGTSTYLPIVKIPIQTAGLIDSVIHDYLRKLLDNFFGPQHQCTNFLGYFFTEMASNIREHSRTEFVWMMSQYWPVNNICEICLIDRGIGLKGAYEAGSMVVESDLKAIENAVSGVSAKGIERGFGISSNIQMFTEDPELEGEFCLISGNSGYLKKWSGRAQTFQLNNFSWLGTIIMVRFKRPSNEVNIYQYAG